MTLALAPRRDENLEVVLPADAISVGIQPGYNWAWSVWNQVTAGLAYPFLLCGVYWYRLGFIIGTLPSLHNALATEVGAGAAGSETTIAQVQDGLFLVSTAPSGVIFISQADTWLLSPTTVPAGTRIALRATQSHTALVMRQRAYIFGYDLSSYSTPLQLPHRFPDVDRYLKGVSASMPIATPITAPVTLTGSGSAWTYGSWNQLVASLSRDTLITGLGFYEATVGNRDFQFHIGLGAASSEIAMSKVALPAGPIGTTSGSGKALLPRPLFVRAGERVSVRCASTWGTTTVKAWLLGYEMK